MNTAKALFALNTHKDCLKRTVKFPKEVMIWGCMAVSGLGFIEIEGTVNAAKHYQIATSKQPISKHREAKCEIHIFSRMERSVIWPNHN